MNDHHTVSESTSWSLISGGVISAGVLLLTIVYFVRSGERDQRSEAETTGDRVRESPKKKKAKPGHDGTYDRGKKRRVPLRVTKSAPGTYKFDLEFTPPVELPASSRGSISLYRGATEIDSGWEIMMGGREQVSWSTRKGEPQNRLPPGLYRVMVNVSDPGTNVPDPFAREVLPAEKLSFQERVLSGRAWTYEIGVRVGSWKEIRRFKRRHVRRVKRNGRKIIEAWDNWRNEVKSAYKLHRNGETVPSSVADRLLEKLIEVRKRCTTFLDRPDQTVSYLWTPDPPFKRKLHSLARTLPTKVNALTVTMLKQLIGGLPKDWPEEYFISGFQFNIDVYRHMNRYHKREVTDLKSSLEDWDVFESAFQKPDAYRRFRLRLLLDIPEAVRRLRRSSRIERFTQALHGRKDVRQSRLRMVVKHMRTLLTFHVSAYHRTMRNMQLQGASKNDLSEVLEASVLSRLNELYTELDVTPPEFLADRLTTLQKSYDVPDRLKQLRRSAKERTDQER